jgi:ribonuclease Z
VIDVALLGTGGMMPLPRRWLSCLLLRVGGQIVLFDCGEGTQVAWRKVGWGFRRLSAICISHTHADHIAGLPGLLHTVANAGRTAELAIYGPRGLGDVMDGLRTIAPTLPFPVRVTELADEAEFMLPAGLRGRCVEGEHQLPVLAFRVDLPRQRAFLPERAQALGVPLQLWRTLQAGIPVAWESGQATPDDVLGPPRRGLSVSYVTDTRPLPAIVELVADSDLLVCEGTYGSDDDLVKAIAHRHMTFREAATLARDAGATRLWITHFSPALEDPAAFAGVATAVFANTIIGYDGLTERLAFVDADSRR